MSSLQCTSVKSHSSKTPQFPHHWALIAITPHCVRISHSLRPPRSSFAPETSFNFLATLILIHLVSSHLFSYSPPLTLPRRPPFYSSPHQHPIYTFSLPSASITLTIHFTLSELPISFPPLFSQITPPASRLLLFSSSPLLTSTGLTHGLFLLIFSSVLHLTHSIPLTSFLSHLHRLHQPPLLSSSCHLFFI